MVPETHPPQNTEQDVRDGFLRHNRQVYGAIAQCVPEWLVNTLYMSCPNDGRSALLHLRTEYGVTTAMDRAAAMARLHRCYLDPRAAIDINHIRYQYDSMREANNDLHHAGGQRLPDAALITLLDAAVARCSAYDNIRMFVSRARHETFTNHFNDYLQVVRSEVQMAELAGEAPQHAAAYAAMPPPPGRHNGGQLSSVFSNNSKGYGKGGKGGKGSKGKDKGKHGRIGKGGKGQSRPSGTIMMCFRCTRLGHSRDECRQPAVACPKCGGDHAESLHTKSDLTFGQRRALLNDAKGRQNPRAASAIPTLGGGESMPDLTSHAYDLDGDDQQEDESGAFVTFAPALPVSSAVHLGGDSMPDLSLLADIFVDTSSTTTFAVAVPQHLSTMPIHDRSRRIFRCASSTSMHEADEETALALSTSVPDVDTRPLSWTEYRYIEFSRSTASIPNYPVGQTEAEADSVRWRVDAKRAAARMHREDLHLARVNSALFQISNDILSSAVDDVHLRAETVLRAVDHIPLQPTDDADLNKLYRSMWALEVLLDGTADQPESDSEDDESESEGYDDLCAWERKRLAAIHRMFIGSDLTPQMIVLPVTSDHWPTGVSFTPSRVDASVPHIGPTYAGPDIYGTRCHGCDVMVMDAMGEVLFEGDLLSQIFEHLFEPVGPVCSRDGCPCTSTYQGIEGTFCCRSCYMGVACPINYHRTPFNPRSTSRPASVALVCSTWRAAWDEAQTAWVRRPYPAALLWMQGLVRDVSTRAYRDADRLERESTARRAMGAVDDLSSTQLIADMVAQEGNLYAAARVHQRRLDAHVAIEPITTSMALTVLSMRSTDTSPQRTLALQVHNSTRPLPEVHYSLPGWNVQETRLQQHVAAMVDDMEGDHSQALVEHPAAMDAHAYPAMPLPLSDRDILDGMSSKHPRLLQTHDSLAAETYIHQSTIPHAGVGLHTRRAFNVGEPVVCMRRPTHVRSWKDADAWVLINELKGADVVIRLNSRSFFLDEAVPEFGDSYDHCPWRAVNDAHHTPSNLAWQIFREKIGTGLSWHLVPVLVATRTIAEGEELLREYSDVSYRSCLPLASEMVGDLEEDAPWVYAALDHLALECQEELDDLLPPRSFIPSSPTSFSDASTSSSILFEPMEDNDFISAASVHFQNAGYAFCARTEPGSFANAPSDNTPPSANFISGTSAHFQNAGSAFGARTEPGEHCQYPPCQYPPSDGVWQVARGVYSPQTIP